MPDLAVKIRKLTSDVTGRRLALSLDSFEEELMKSYLILHPFGRYDKVDIKKKLKQLLAAAVSSIVAVLGTLNVLVAAGVSSVPDLQSYQIFSYLPSYAAILLQLTITLSIGLGVSVGIHFRIAESKKTIDQVSYFYPSLAVSPEKLGLNGATYKKFAAIFGTTAAMTMLVTRIVQASGHFLYMILWLGSSIRSQHPFLSALQRLPHHICVQVYCRYFLFIIIQIAAVMFVSTIFLSLRVRQVCTFLNNSNNWTRVSFALRDITSVHRTMLRHNLLAKNILRDTVILYCPLISLIIIMMTSEQFPELIKTFILICTIPMFSLIQFSLYSCSNLYSKSHVVINLLQSIQSKCKTISIYDRLQIKKAVKLLTSNRKPLCFTLPDETLLTPLRSLGFAAEAVSNTFVFLNNGLI